ncbi:ELWxxDGT repeat protein [Pyxidicoccus sp. 3LFB2]
MRSWRPLSVVLALLTGCSTSGGSKPPPGNPPPPPPGNGGPSVPCGRTASRLGPAPSPSDTGSPQMVPGAGALFFIAEAGATGEGIWASSGPQGPAACLVRDFPPGPTGQGPSEPTRVGDAVFFAAEDPEHGRELWVSNGRAAGTRRVKDLWPGPTGSEPQSLFESGGLLYFAASDPEHGRELWRSDGTPEGTVLVQDLDPGAEGTSPDRMTRGADGALYFLAHFRGLSTVLMRSAGGSAAVELEKVPSEGGILEPLTTVDRRLFYIMGHLHDPTVHLMATDGSAPVLVGEFGTVREAVALGGQLYFSATTGAAGTDAELWRSDGTAQGTQRVKDLRTGEAGSLPGDLTVLGSRLFFVADDGVHGRELWVSDGTDAGTRLFADLVPGAGSAAPEALTPIQGHLFFSAETPERGREPWMSDGTPAGMVPLDELAPEARASDPRGFTRAGGEVFFTADDGSGTRGLWALPLRPRGQCPGPTN